MKPGEILDMVLCRDLVIISDGQELTLGGTEAQPPPPELMAVPCFSEFQEIELCDYYCALAREQRLAISRKASLVTRCWGWPDRISYLQAMQQHKHKLEKLRQKKHSWDLRHQRAHHARE